jgi:hypothetical protein
MKKILILIAIAILGGGLYGWYLYNKPVEDINDLESEITLDADSLSNHFHNDEAAANTKYLGKIVEVHGVVRDLNVDDAGNTVIVKTENKFFGINCGLSKGQETLFENYKIGDKIKIRGECAGYDIDVVMTRCVILNDK